MAGKVRVLGVVASILGCGDRPVVAREGGGGGGSRQRCLWLFCRFVAQANGYSHNLVICYGILLDSQR